MDVTEAPDKARFEIHDGNVRVGLIQYVDRDGVLLMTHTEVDPSVGGRGIGSELVKASLDQVRSSGRRVVPLCSFVAAYIDKHPEYEDLVATI